MTYAFRCQLISAALSPCVGLNAEQDGSASVHLYEAGCLSRVGVKRGPNRYEMRHVKGQSQPDILSPMTRQHQRSLWGKRNTGREKANRCECIRISQKPTPFESAPLIGRGIERLSQNGQQSTQMAGKPHLGTSMSFIPGCTKPCFDFPN